MHVELQNLGTKVEHLPLRKFVTIVVVELDSLMVANACSLKVLQKLIDILTTETIEFKIRKHHNPPYSTSKKRSLVGASKE